jgi:hypothetical protein
MATAWRGGAGGKIMPPWRESHFAFSSLVRNLDATKAVERLLVSSRHVASGLHLFFSCPFERGFPEPDARSAPVLVDELDASVLKGAANRKIIGCG